MAEQQLNGYLTASQLLTNAIDKSLQQGATVDEVLAALKVQSEVILFRLTQVLQRCETKTQQEELPF